jgi:hypothetical protein
VSDDPVWLTEALEVLTDPLGLSRNAVRMLAETASKHAKGLVTRGYNIETDTVGWVYGRLVFDRLLDSESHRFTDDPFVRDTRDEIPLAEFLTYLQDWYWPKKKKLREAAT